MAGNSVLPFMGVQVSNAYRECSKNREKGFHKKRSKRQSPTLAFSYVAPRKARKIKQIKV